MPVILSSYRLGPGQRASYKTVPAPWDWLLRRENELGPRRSRSQIIFAVLVPPLYVAVQAPALIVTKGETFLRKFLNVSKGSLFKFKKNIYFATEWMLKVPESPPFQRAKPVLLSVFRVPCKRLLDALKSFCYFRALSGDADWLFRWLFLVIQIQVVN